MQEHQEAMIKSLVAVAWADGQLHGDESQIIDALISAFALSDADAAAIRTYAKSPRTLDDVPLTELSRGDRQLLLQHAIFVTHADKVQSDAERKIIGELAAKLRLDAAEATQLIEATEQRVKALAALL